MKLVEMGWLDVVAAGWQPSTLQRQEVYLQPGLKERKLFPVKGLLPIFQPCQPDRQLYLYVSENACFRACHVWHA